MTAGAGVRVDGTVHAVDGAQVAVVSDGRVLLQLRPWPPGWEMPGGHLGPGEAPEACAAREVREETGLQVRIGGLVGVYRWSGLRRRADAVYWAEPLAGRPHRSIEAISLRWCAPDRLPRTTFPWIAARARDGVAAAAGVGPVLRDQPITARHVLFFGSAWLAHALDAVRRPGRRRP